MLERQLIQALNKIQDKEVKDLAFGAGVAIAAVVASIAVIVGVKIFTDVNAGMNWGNATQPAFLGLIPTLLGALLVIGIVVYFGAMAGGR